MSVSLLLWFALLVAGIVGMQWGSSRVADVLDAVRGRFGLPATAGGALMGLATASPEISVSVASVAFGWPNLGLGTALGSNIPALPLAILLAWLAGRFARGKGERAPDHDPIVAPQAVEVQIGPYLAICILLGVLTVPPAWAGLQAVDGLVLVAAFVAYFLHALLRKPWSDRGHMPKGIVRRGLVGVPAIVIGALASVIGAQRIGAQLGISELVTGLFVIGFLCALPEAYSAWRFTREGRPTVAIATATADGIVSLTIALVPPALAGTEVGNRAVYLVSLVFLIGVLATYIALDRTRQGQELGPDRVVFFGSAYLVYLAAIAFVLW